MKAAAALIAISLIATLIVPAAGASGDNTNLNALLQKMDQIYAELTIDERGHVEAAQSAARDLTEGDLSIVNEVWNKIEAKLDEAEGVEVDQITKENTLKLIAFFADVYQPSDTGSGSIADIPADLRGMLDQLVELAGLTDTLGPLTKEDIAEFALAIENAAWDVIPTDYNYLLDLITEKDEIFSIVDEAIDLVLSSDEQMDFKEVLQFYGITKDELKPVLKKAKAAIDPEEDAAMSLLIAYLRYSTVGPYLGNPENIDGLTHDYYSINVAGFAGIPVTAFDWETSDPSVTAVIADDNSKLRVTASAPGKVDVIATINLGEADEYGLFNKRELFRETVVFGTETGVATGVVGDLVPGQEFTVRYMIGGFLNGDATNSAQFDIEYDSNVFELAGTVEEAVRQILPGTVTHTDGKLGYLIADTGVTYPLLNGTTAYEVTFRVKESAITGPAYEITSPANTVVLQGDVPKPIAAKTLTLSVLGNVEPKSALSGNVGLVSSRVDKSGITINVVSGTDTVATVTTDVDGNFEVALEAGTYTVEIVMPGYIKRTFNNVVVGNEDVVLSDAPITLIAGDTNGDGLVNANDYTILLANYGTTKITHPDSFRDSVDFNGDGLINANDYTILLSNYGRTSLDY